MNAARTAAWLKMDPVVVAMEPDRDKRLMRLAAARVLAADAAPKRGGGRG